MASRASVTTLNQSSGKAWSTAHRKAQHAAPTAPREALTTAASKAGQPRPPTTRRAAQLGEHPAGSAMVHVALRDSLITNYGGWLIERRQLQPARPMASYLTSGISISPES